jgi:DNA repair protein RadC
MLLRSGTRGQDVLTLASRLVAESGSLAGLLAWHEADFRSLRGIGRVKALQLVAAMEVARRAMRLPPQEPPVLNRADLIAGHLEPVASGLEVEKFWVLCLNRRNRLRKRVEVSSGTATAALAHPREVFRSAIREAAAAVVCAHNHPSGVLLSGKKIRICRIRPQRGRFRRGFPRVEKSLGYEGLGDRKEINKWVGCRGGACPAPLVNWGEGTWPTGDTSRLKFSRPSPGLSGENRSNMNRRGKGPRIGRLFIPSFAPPAFPILSRPPWCARCAALHHSRRRPSPSRGARGSALSGLGGGRRACTGQRAWRTSENQATTPDREAQVRTLL